MSKRELSQEKNVDLTCIQVNVLKSVTRITKRVVGIQID